MSQFIKLDIYIIYGNLVSAFFYINNTIVENNMTAHAKSAVWYIKKELCEFQAITDRCCFELSRIIYSRSHLMNRKLFKIEFQRKNRNIFIKPLLGCEITNHKLWIVKLYKEFYNLIHNKLIKHIKSMFPRVDIWNNFDLEIKKSCY